MARIGEIPCGVWALIRRGTNSNRMDRQCPFGINGEIRQRLPIGLFYGGGIESNAALTALLPYCPNLFILEGPAWMNNDTRGDLRLKRGLEREVSTNHGLDLLYARMNRLRAIRRMRC